MKTHSQALTHSEISDAKNRLNDFRDRMEEDLGNDSDKENLLAPAFLKITQAFYKPR